MSHQLNFKDLQEWLDSNQLIVFASSTTDDKKLYATLKGGFEVHKGKEVICRTMQPFSAIEAYNNI